MRHADGFARGEASSIDAPEASIVAQARDESPQKRARLLLEREEIVATASRALAVCDERDRLLAEEHLRLFEPKTMGQIDPANHGLQPAALAVVLVLMPVRVGQRARAGAIEPRALVVAQHPLRGAQVVGELPRIARADDHRG